MSQDFSQRRRQRSYQQLPDIEESEKLSVDEVETIIRRAVELQVEDDLSLPSLDEKALHRVARELGIEAGHLRRAVVEARTTLTGPDTGWLDQVFAPNSVSTSRVIAGDREEVESRLGEWLNRHEGLRLRRKDRDGGVWEKDRHILTQIRMGLRMNRGSRVLRNSRKVAHRIQSMRDDEQVVALEAETHTLKSVGVGAVATLGAVAAAAGAVGAVTGDPAIAIPAAAGGFALASGGVVLGVRMWLNRIRDGLERVLDGITGRRAVEEDPLEKQVRRLRDGIREATDQWRKRSRW
jgi:hypothetical protein